MSETTIPTDEVEAPEAHPHLRRTIIGQHGLVYEVVRELGLGGMAETYVVQRRVQERVAFTYFLKRMRDKSKKEEFLDEAYIMSLLSHKRIVPAVDVDKDKAGRWFLCLEYVDGVDLAQLLKYYEDRKECMPEVLAAWIVHEVLDALVYAHELEDKRGPLKIVHRDVTPSNILLSRKGDVMLTDFGIARFRAKARYTATGCVKGKVRYMAPEQFASEQSLDARTDLFSVGATWFEMLTGIPPYGDPRNELSVIEALGEGRMHPLAEFAPDIDPRTAQLLERMLHVDRKQRPLSARETMAALPTFASEPVLRDSIADMVEDCIRQREHRPPRAFDGNTGRAARLLAARASGLLAESAAQSEDPSDAQGSASIEIGRPVRGQRRLVQGAAVGLVATVATVAMVIASRAPAREEVGALTSLHAQPELARPTRVEAPAPEPDLPRFRTESARPIPEQSVAGPAIPDALPPSQVAQNVRGVPPRPKTGTLIVTVRAPNAAIWVNGVLQPLKRPLVLENLPPGRYRVEASQDANAPGRVHAEARVGAGRTARVDFELPASF